MKKLFNNLKKNKERKKDALKTSKILASFVDTN